MTKKIKPKSERQINSSDQTVGFPVVGIGASAGGLESFETFFEVMPGDCGMAFVLVSHLSPDHISILPELIQKKTPMLTLPIEDGQRIQPNTIYVLPPNKKVEIKNGILKLGELVHTEKEKLPIDFFFKSLAKDQGDNAICIILSGTGTDGTAGLQQTAGETGLVIVQSVETAKYGGMPQSAISTGLVDHILPVEKMPEKLLGYYQNVTTIPKLIYKNDEKNIQSYLKKIILNLLTKTSHDFSLYKKNTILRRIERRMNINQINDMGSYLAFLEKNESEPHALFKDLLIGVTSFFRDPQAFDALQELLMSDVFHNKPDGYKMRVWIAGCSTGEEAYSICILLLESIERLNRNYDIQIFATDLDENAINVARSGLYPLTISDDVSPERLKKYFNRDSSQYKVKTTVRERIVFATQNLINEPPFTKLDLICCRNLLIYLDSELQKKLFPMFHYSLKTDGLLFLGPSESIGQDEQLFKQKNKRWKIFTRVPLLSAFRSLLDFPSSAMQDINYVKNAVTANDKRDAVNGMNLVEYILKQSNTPPCSIIDEQCNIVYTHGRTGRYLEPPIGTANINILNMARPGLKFVLAEAIRKAAALQQDITQKDVEVETDTGSITIDLTVKPFITGNELPGMLMVVYNETNGSKNRKKGDKKQRNTEIVQLEREIKYTRDTLQITIEELKTSNEELMSTNEELQSTNEELETSKEELQSLHEESTTVNAELQSRIEELSAANDDMKNLLDSTPIGTIFLDINLNIRRYNQIVTNLIPLNSTDIGRPVKHFATEFRTFNLADSAEKVLNNLTVEEFEVESKDTRWFRTKVRPYRTMNNVIDGVVLTFEDITEFKRIAMTSKRLVDIMSDSEDAIIIVNQKGKISFWNSGAKQIYGYNDSEVVGMDIYEFVPQTNKQETLSCVEKALTGKHYENSKTKRRTKDGKTISIIQTIIPIKDNTGNYSYLVFIERSSEF